MVISQLENSTDYCPECNGHIISLRVEGEIVCSQCGLIIMERELDISTRGTSHFNSTLMESSSHGMPITKMVPDIALCTIIRANETPNNFKRVISHNTILPWKTKNMIIALSELKRICYNLNIPTYVKNRALKLYKGCFKANMLRGRSITAMVAACSFYACKEKNYPIFFDEIIKESASNDLLIKKCYNLLIKTFKLDPHNINPVYFIPRFRVQLGLGIEIEHLCIKILDRYLQDHSIVGKNPKGLCAGALYLACKLKDIKLRQKDIADIFKITEITLRSRYKEIMERIRIL